MVSDSPLHLRLLPAMAKAFHFLLRPAWVIVHPAVHPVRVRVDWPVACQRPAKERGSHRIVAAVSFAACSSLGIVRLASPLFDLCHSQIGFVTADLFRLRRTAVGLFAAGLSPAVVAVVFVAVAVGPFAVAGLDPAAAADSAYLFCPSAVVMGKGKVAALVASYFLVPRFSSLRSRSCLLPPCFAIPA